MCRWRVTVDDQGGHNEDLSRAARLHDEARGSAVDLWETLAPVVNGDQAGEMRERLRDELPDLRGLVVDPTRQEPILIIFKSAASDRPDPVIGAHHPTAIHFGDGGVSDDPDAKAFPLGLDASMGDNRISGRAHGATFNLYIGAAGQRRQEAGHELSRHSPVEPQPHDALYCAVIFRKRELGGFRRSEGDIRDGILGVICERDALELESPSGSSEPVADLWQALCERASQAAPCESGLIPGDDRPGDVYASIQGTRAVTGPVLIIGPQVNRERWNIIKHLHAEDDLVLSGSLK
jgi:hypothetical protein